MCGVCPGFGWCVCKHEEIEERERGGQKEMGERNK